MSGKSRDLLLPLQHLMSRHNLLGDTMAVRSDRAWVQTPGLGSPQASLPQHCQPSWPSILLLGERARLFSMHRAGGCSLGLRPAHSFHWWAGWAAGFPRTSVLRRTLKQGFLPTSVRENPVHIHSQAQTPVGCLVSTVPKTHGAMHLSPHPHGQAPTCHPCLATSLRHRVSVLSGWWQKGWACGGSHPPALAGALSCDSSWSACDSRGDVWGRCASEEHCTLPTTWTLLCWQGPEAFSAWLG